MPYSWPFQQAPHWSVIAAVAVGGYAIHCGLRSRLLSWAERRCCRIGPQWLGLATHFLLSSWSALNGVQVESEAGEGLDTLDSKTQYMIVWHPHGIIAWSALFVLSKMAVVGHPLKREWFALVAPVLFQLPFVSEALMLVNGRRVVPNAMEALLAGGANIAIQPGGVREQIATTHDQEQAMFADNLGFIRKAIKYGVTIVPVYVFGENQLYKRVSGFDAFSTWIYRTTGAGLPCMTAKFGLPMVALMPRSVPLHIRWGKPLEVGPKDPNPSDERVEEVFAQYKAALLELFDKYKYECLPAEVADKGLKIIRLEKSKSSRPKKE